MKLPFTIGNRPIQGNFDFLLKLLGANRIVRGSVSSTGTINEGTGFTAAKTATGQYTVTFTTAFASAPVVVLGVGSTGFRSVRHATGSPPTTTQFFVSVDVPNTGAAADGEFHFIAIGP